MSASLALDAVSKRFAGSSAPAVDGLSLDVDAGACTAILGPSGSGKSTVLRLIAGLETPDTGRIVIDGADVARIAAERRGVGMVSQKALLFPHLSVLDNVAFAERVRGGSRTAARVRAADYLDMVQLGGFGPRRVGELSGGQEQRVAIARALAAGPAVLLLDEPFSALDPALRADMHALIDQVRQALSPTIVLVTHDRDEASRVADRIAVLEHGALLHESTVADAYRRPRTLRAAQLMGGRNAVPGAVVGSSHHSPLGVVPVPAGVVDGPAVLVVRQEDLGIRDASDITLGDADADAAIATGEIESLRFSGARTEVSVRCAGDVVLHAEVPSSQRRRLGERVGLSIPHDAVHVVPG